MIVYVIIALALVVIVGNGLRRPTETPVEKEKVQK